VNQVTDTQLAEISLTIALGIFTNTFNRINGIDGLGRSNGDASAPLAHRRTGRAHRRLQISATRMN
jgi:hypothetical protein